MRIATPDRCSGILIGMKAHLFRSFLVVLGLVLGGCESQDVVVVIDPQDVPLPPGAEVVVVDDQVAIAEIDAAAGQSFDSSRRDMLQRIARRPNLGAAGQVHLVKTTFRCLDFESSQVGVLMTLIDNPALRRDAKLAILDHLPQLTFDSSRTRVLRALDKRGPLLEIGVAATGP